MCLEKLLFVYTDLIFKNYEAQMFCWRKNCAKDISKDAAGKESSMNKKKKNWGPSSIFGFGSVIGKYKTKGSRKVVTGWGSDRRSLGL